MLSEQDEALLADVEVAGRPGDLPLDPAVQIVWPIALKLLERDGYLLQESDALGFTHMLALRPAAESRSLVRTGIIYRQYGRDGTRGRNWHRAFSLAVQQGSIDRALLVPNGALSLGDDLRQHFPVEIGVLDWPAIEAWASRIRQAADSPIFGVKHIVQNASREYARLVARHPAALHEIEWRDLERLMAAAFASFGFEVELTPSSKDGGKDLVLRCTVEREQQSYAVEIKHWRSGQRVRKKLLRDFVHVIAREDHRGGLYLATSGYSANSVEVLMEVGQQELELAAAPRMVRYCQMYSKVESGLWSPPQNITELIFGGGTLDTNSQAW